MLKQLLEIRPDLSQVKLSNPFKDEDNHNTLLHFAVSEHCTEAVQLLINVAPELISKNDEDYDPLELAIDLDDNTEIFELIVKKLHERSELYDYLPELFLIHTGDLLDILLKVDPNILQQTIKGGKGNQEFDCNILEYLACNDNADMVELLINKYPNLVVVPAAEEVTNILHRTLQYGLNEVSKLLIKAKPKLGNTFNDECQSALDIVLDQLKNTTSNQENSSQYGCFDEELIKLVIDNNHSFNDFQLLTALDMKLFDIANLLIMKDPSILKSLFENIDHYEYYLNNIEDLYSYMFYLLGNNQGQELSKLQALDALNNKGQELSKLQVLMFNNVKSLAENNSAESAEKLKCLLVASSKQNLIKDFYKIILDAAIINGNTNLLKMLSDHNKGLLTQILDEKTEDNAFLTNAIIAASNSAEHEEFLKELLSMTTNVNNGVDLGDFVMTPLLHSVHGKTVNAFKLLLNHKEIKFNSQEVLSAINTREDSKEVFSQVLEEYMQSHMVISCESNILGQNSNHHSADLE